MIALVTAAALAAPAPLAVRDRAFVVRDLESGEVIRDARGVPNRPETVCYDWVIAVAPQLRTVEVIETFVLPAPASWGIAEGEATTVAADQRRAVTRLTEDVSDGQLTHGWCVAAGDPPGNYRIEVSAEGKTLGTFRFVLLPDDDTV